MVSLLLISHSAAIAAGVKQLAEQMAGGRVAIAAAGGTTEGEIGTSVEVISQALAALPADDGILVLVDLGSAVMSAEIALEHSGVRYLISNAPLVEGAIFAAAQASLGASLEQSAAEAEKARNMVKVHA
jgi:dihydroxyacetone kinase phosphotransfer subunit